MPHSHVITSAIPVSSSSCLKQLSGFGYPENKRMRVPNHGYGHDDGIQLGFHERSRQQYFELYWNQCFRNYKGNGNDDVSKRLRKTNVIHEHQVLFYR